MSYMVIQYIFYFAILVALAIPLGGYIGKIMNGEHIWLERVLGPVERFFYKLMRVKSDEQMTWKKYLGAALAFNAFGLVIMWVILMLQGYLPLNPMHIPGMSWDLALNTAISFVTNTNWQAYSGEVQLSYLSQFLCLTTQNFVSAATGIAVLFAIIRGLFQVKSKGLGSYWADMTRVVLYLLLPLSLIGAVILMSQGVPQNFSAGQKVQLVEPLAQHDVALDADGNALAGATISEDGTTVTTAEGKTLAVADEAVAGESVTVETQFIDGAVIDGDTVKDADGNVVADAQIVREMMVPLGPGASQIAIKQLGTNGGGFYGVNSALALENPTPLSNLVEMLYLLLIPVALCFTFGRNVKSKKQGIAIFLAMFIMLVGATAVTATAEANATPQLAQNGQVLTETTAVNEGGNMEGKEARFGIAPSATWATWTTAASNGSVNSMHDSNTPLGGMIPMLLMMLGEVVFGGVGCGLYGMLGFVIFTVFIAGLMVGRTPEYLGKKVEPYEMKMASLACLATPIGVLVGSGLACLVPQVMDSLNNVGPHGLSEVLYAYASAGGNNGSAFAGFGANTPFLNVSLGLVMLFVRFVPLSAMLAIGGSMTEKKRLAVTAGTLSTSNGLFVFLLIFIVLLVGALSFFPALALGPIADHLQMLGIGM